MTIILLAMKTNGFKIKVTNIKIRKEEEKMAISENEIAIFLYVCYTEITKTYRC